jgi:hypothetical protein
VTDRAVLKWQVAVDDREHRIGGGEIVHVAVQYPDQPDVVTVWTVEPRNRDAVTAMRLVRVFGTGHPLPYFATPLGSAVTANGRLVWHLFELPEVEPKLPYMEGVEDVPLPEASVAEDTADATAKIAP